MSTEKTKKMKSKIKNTTLQKRQGFKTKKDPLNTHYDISSGCTFF